MRLVKRLREHPLMRPLAWVVLTALLAGTGGLVPAASAQDVEVKRAAVLDFVNQTKAPLAADEAASALALALKQRDTEVISRALVQQAVRDAGVRAPYEPDEVRQLGKSLDVRKLMSGTVLVVDEQIGARSSIRVVLRLDAYDGESGDMVNGGYGEGFEELTGGDTAEREAGRARAIERAIGQALDRIAGRTIIQASVMQFSPPARVLINKGRKLGVYPGMLFDVFRTEADPDNPQKSLTVKVGRIKVTVSSNDDAEGVVLEQRGGVNTHDRLREVFSLPALESGSLNQPGKVQGPEGARPRGGTGSAAGLVAGIGGALLGIGAIALLLSLNNNSVQNAPRVNASNGAVLRQAAPGQNPSVQVQWADRDFAPPKNYIGGYLVYRGISDGFAALNGDVIGAVVGSSPRKYSDDPTWVDLAGIDIPVNYQRVDTDGTTTDVNETVTVRIVHQSVQPGQTYYYKVRRIGPSALTAPPTLIQNQRGRARTAQQIAHNRAIAMRQAAHGNLLVSGGNMIVTRHGIPTRQVTNIPPGANYDPTLDPAADNTVTGLGADVALSNASVAVGPLTYMVPPDLLAPANNNQAQRVDDISFQYQGVLGATEYVVQIATDTNFSSLVFQSAAIATTSTGQLSFRYDSTAPGFKTLAANTQYFWRVGAKSTFRNQPAPQPDGYVFSSIFTFQTADQPPSNPRYRR